MQTQTIPAEQWVEFFDSFSREHVGWPITIEVLDATGGPEKLADNLPLQGISFDTKGTRPSTIEISAGAQPGGHVNHVVDMPLNIRQVQEPNGDLDLQIEPARGPITLIHLRSPTH